MMFLNSGGCWITCYLSNDEEAAGSKETKRPDGAAPNRRFQSLMGRTEYGSSTSEDV